MLNKQMRAILEVLTQPLSAKKIYFGLKKVGYGVATYQAVHKTLKQMVDEGVLHKENMEYVLNKEWVEEQKKSLDHLMKNEETPQSALLKLEKKKEISFTYQTIMGMGYFLLYFLYKISDKNDNPIISHTRFIYSLLTLSGMEYLILKKVVDSNTITCLSVDNNGWDHLMRKQWERAGATVATGVLDATLPCDVWIMRPYVIHIYFPPEVFDKVHNEFYETKKDDDFDYRFIQELCFEEKHEMKLIITLDEKLCEQIEQKTIEILDKQDA